MCYISPISIYEACLNGPLQIFRLKLFHDVPPHQTNMTSCSTSQIQQPKILVYIDNRSIYISIDGFSSKLRVLVCDDDDVIIIIISIRINKAN